jgi:acyl-CoA thioester hydrolase
MSASPSCSIEFRVRYAETDQMGIVYHANYLPWCEIGRTELIRRLWRSYAELEAAGVLLAVTEATLRYHASARYDELVRVDTTLDQVRSRGVSFRYDIFRVEDERRLVTARTELVAIDRAGTPVRLPPALMQAFRGHPAPESAA